MSDPRTPGPLTATDGGTILADSTGLHVFMALRGGERARANAARMLACWNACEGLPLEALQGGTVAGLAERVRTLEADILEFTEAAKAAIPPAEWPKVPCARAWAWMVRQLGFEWRKVTGQTEVAHG